MVAARRPTKETTTPRTQDTVVTDRPSRKGDEGASYMERSSEQEKDSLETYLAHSTINLTTPTPTNPSPHSGGADKAPVDTAVIDVQSATTTFDGAETGIERLRPK